VKLLVLLTTYIPLALLLNGCAADECDNAGTASENQCDTEITILPPEVANLEIALEDTTFYDQNSESWQDVSGSTLTSGNVISTIPIYSNTLGLSETEALNSVRDAKNHRSSPGSFSPSVYNRVPYIQLKAETGVTYLYRYQRKSPSGTILYDKTGTIPLADGKATLPLINSLFDNQLYGSTARIGDLANHTLYITAQAAGVISKKVQRIDFRTNYSIPSLDFRNELSPVFANLKLSDRWVHYYDSTKIAANTDLKFASLMQKALPESIPLDVRIRFEQPPKLEILQDVFYEVPFEYETFIDSGNIVPSRGYAFNGKTVKIDSDNDFRIKVKLGDNNLSTISATEYRVNNLAAGTPLNVSFHFDFTENEKYGQYCLPPTCPTLRSGDPNGKGLLTPLKPMCQLEKNIPFVYHTEREAKESAEASNLYYSICHPDTNQAESNFAVLDRTETYFDFFNYAPRRDSKKWLGHFNGIRNKTYRISGCVQLAIKGAGEPDSAFEIKTSGSNGCNTSERYTYFSIEKTVDMFSEIQSIEDIVGLKELITLLSNRTLQSTPHFKFNGDDLSSNSNTGDNSFTANENRHLY